MFDPNWLAAIGQCIAAIGTIAAVVVALRIANESGKQAREQARQLHYDAMRPVLVIARTICFRARLTMTFG